MTATITYSPLLGALCSNQWLTAQQISRGGHRVQAAIVAQQLLPDGMAQRLRLTTPPALALAHARPSYETDALPPPQLVYMEQPALGLATAHDAPPPLPHARVARPSRVVQATALKPHGPPTVPALDALPGGPTTRIDCTEYSTDPRYDCSGDTQTSEITAVLGGIACRYTDKARDNRDCTDE